MMFGTPYWIFPMSIFDYTYVESDDFNYSSSNWNIGTFLEYIRDRRWEDPDLDDYGWDGKGLVVNKDFDKAYNRGYEVWFQCDRYYYIDLTSPLAIVFAREMNKQHGIAYMPPSI
jgi:hypothetical protein